ncbi:hypothetical protein HK405_003045 [Cladochytrium tenue]|nr:hypothetical protein HK405_003045 [Cladochytrium tenue]
MDLSQLPEDVFLLIGLHLDGSTIWSLANTCQHLRQLFLATRKIWESSLSRLKLPLPNTLLQDLSLPDLIDMARRYTAPNLPDKISFSYEALPLSSGNTSLPVQSSCPPGLGGEWIATRRILHMDYRRPDILERPLLPCFFRHRRGFLLCNYSMPYNYIDGESDEEQSFEFFDVESGLVHPISCSFRTGNCIQIHGTDMVVEILRHSTETDAARLLLWDDEAKDLIPLAPEAQERFSAKIYQTIASASPTERVRFFYTSDSPGCLTIADRQSRGGAFAANLVGTDLILLGHVPLAARAATVKATHMRSFSVRVEGTYPAGPFQAQLYNWRDPDGVYTDGPAPAIEEVPLEFGRGVFIERFAKMDMDETRLVGVPWVRYMKKYTEGFIEHASVAVVDVVRRQVLLGPLSTIRQGYDFAIVVEDLWTNAQDAAVVKRELSCHLVKFP